MDSPSTEKGSERVIRLSLSWVLLGFIIVAVIGILGGVVGQQLLQPALFPLTSEADRLVTTVQEVTISPGAAAAQIVERSQRSVVAIGQGIGNAAQVLATGLVVTNDGLVVTTANSPSGLAVAYDSDGRTIPLQLVGEDAIYGLTYFRMTDGVFVPLELRSEEVPIAANLLVLARSPTSLQPRIRTYTLTEYTLPTTGAPAGLQRLLKGSGLADSTLIGSPLLDEEGKVSGLLLDDTTGLAAPASVLQQSIDRVISQRREFDPFANTGIHLSYNFQPSRDSTRLFTATVQPAIPASPAAIAGVASGDQLTAIGEEAITWETNIAELLSQQLPLSVTVRRGDQEHVLTLQPPSETP